MPDRLAALLREGGETNMARLLGVLQELLEGASPDIDQMVVPLPDPLPWDWQDDVGATVGVVLYRAQLQAGDTTLWRSRSIRPSVSVKVFARAFWVSSLRDAPCRPGSSTSCSQGTQVVITGTAFASVRRTDAGVGSPFGTASIDRCFNC